MVFKIYIYLRDFLCRIQRNTFLLDATSFRVMGGKLKKYSKNYSREYKIPKALRQTLHTGDFFCIKISHQKPSIKSADGKNISFVCKIIIMN